MPNYTGSFSIFGSGRRYEEIKKNNRNLNRSKSGSSSKPEVTKESYERNLTAKFAGLNRSQRMELLNTLKQEALNQIAESHNLNLSKSKDLEKAMEIGAKISPMLFSNILLKQF